MGDIKGDTRSVDYSSLGDVLGVVRIRSFQNIKQREMKRLFPKQALPGKDARL